MNSDLLLDLLDDSMEIQILEQIMDAILDEQDTLVEATSGEWETTLKRACARIRDEQSPRADLGGPTVWGWDGQDHQPPFMAASAAL